MQLILSEKIRICDWEIDTRPREKLLSKGPQEMSNAELLAILINTGTPQNNALELAREVLKKGGDDLVRLSNLTVKDLTRIKGMGKAKAARIAAAIELGKRKEEWQEREKSFLRTGVEAASYMMSKLKHHKQEVFAVICLNSAQKILKFAELSRGGLTSTVADPRIIFKTALEENAISIILGHNHPSGNLRPSQADKMLTRKIQEGAKYLDINLLDHIIVSEKGYFSFADEGVL